MVTCTINDKVIQAEEGKTILEIARDAGIHIPTLCYHKELSPYGACRLCVVEIVGGARQCLQVACLYKVTEGLIVKTDTKRVVQARKIIIELLMARCPNSDKIKKLGFKPSGKIEEVIKNTLEGLINRKKAYFWKIQ